MFLNMAEAVNHARNLYVKLNIHQASLPDDDKKLLETDIRKFIYISIKEVISRNVLYINPFLLYILQEAIQLHSTNSDDVMPIAKAFEYLEKYFLLLIKHPWKPEFKKIKTYGGFYKTKIRSVLPECDKVFQLAGYSFVKEHSVLIYDKPINKNNLLLLAFDCKISYSLCIMIYEQYDKLKSLGETIRDVVSNFLRNEAVYQMNEEFCNSHASKMLSNNSILPPAIPKREPLKYESVVIYDDRDTYECPPPVPERNNIPSSYHGTCVKLPPNIPFDDQIPEAEVLPDFTYGTMDKHILDSWNMVTKPDRIYPDPPKLEDYKWDQRNTIYNAPYPLFQYTHPHRMRQEAFQGSIDEGIGSSTSYKTSLTGTNSSSHPLFFPPSIGDAGYKTQSADYLMNTLALSDGNPPLDVLRQTAVPPPIPSRKLKPNYPTKGMTEVEGNPAMDGQFNLQAFAKRQSQSEIISTYKGGLAVPATKQTHLSDKIPITKSSSLKYYGNTSHPQLVTEPLRHSIDITQWQCSTCTTINNSLSKICSICSRSRSGPDVSQSVDYGQTVKKCLNCSAKNSSYLVECNACGAKLFDRYTLV